MARNAASAAGWITSQNDTAPKLVSDELGIGLRWITSQNDTAPKLLIDLVSRMNGWITSQNDTAPKHWLPP